MLIEGQENKSDETIDAENSITPQKLNDLTKDNKLKPTAKLLSKKIATLVLVALLVGVSIVVWWFTLRSNGTKGIVKKENSTSKAAAIVAKIDSKLSSALVAKPAIDLEYSTAYIKVDDTHYTGVEADISKLYQFGQFDAKDTESKDQPYDCNAFSNKFKQNLDTVTKFFSDAKYGREVGFKEGPYVGPGGQGPDCRNVVYLKDSTNVCSLVLKVELDQTGKLKNKENKPVSVAVIKLSCASTRSASKAKDAASEAIKIASDNDFAYGVYIYPPTYVKPSTTAGYKIAFLYGNSIAHYYKKDGDKWKYVDTDNVGNIICSSAKSDTDISAAFKGEQCAVVSPTADNHVGEFGTI